MKNFQSIIGRNSARDFFSNLIQILRDPKMLQEKHVFDFPLLFNMSKIPRWNICYRIKQIMNIFLSENWFFQVSLKCRDKRKNHKQIKLSQIYEIFEICENRYYCARLCFCRTRPLVQTRNFRFLGDLNCCPVNTNSYTLTHKSTKVEAIYVHSP